MWIPRQEETTHPKTASSIGLIRLFFIMALSTFIVILVLGISSFLQAKYLTSPTLTMKGLTSALSSDFFIDLLALEARSIKDDNRAPTFSGKNLSNFLVRLFININPKDPKSLLASQLPGMPNNEAIELRTPSTGLVGPAPYEYPPIQGSMNNVNDANMNVLSLNLEWDMRKILEPVDNQHIQSSPIDPLTVVSVPSALAQRKKVFVYQSHSRESFLPELEGVTEPDQAYDGDINVRLLGKRLTSELADLGVGALHSDVDYNTKIKDHNWNLSYSYSSDTVKEAFAGNPDLDYFIDIHRDSFKRDETTIEFNGKSYAKVAFVVGLENPNWEKNEAFATKLHNKLEASYPGLSRGTWGKDKSSGNGEYNQSLSPNSIIVEVGGVENTLEECYRTIELLAKVIAETVVDAELVNQSVNTDKEAA